MVKRKKFGRKSAFSLSRLLLETNKSYAEVAQIVGKAPSSIKKWAKAFREKGLSGLLERGNGGGRKGYMTPEVKEAIVEKLREGSFRTAKQFKHWLETDYGINISLKGLYYQLGKLGGRLKVPRPSHTKKDQQKVDEFKVTLADKLVALDLPKDQEVRLWVYDEMRYGLHPLLRKMWSLRGQRVIAPVNRRFEWGYLFGALEVSKGGSEFLYTDRVLKAFDRAFLEQISQSDPDCIHVVIGDGAGFHHREGLFEDDPIAKNLHILTLPPYSPELNPVEKLWDIVKDSICTTMWETLTDLEEQITSTLKELWERVDGFSSLFTNSYLRSELNATTL